MKNYTDTGANGTDAAAQMALTFSDYLDEEIDLAGGELEEREEYKGSVGRTMFDTPTSKDHTVTVVMPADNLAKLPSQSLVRIKSRPRDQGGDGRQYLGAVTQGPFAEPDGLRADAPIIVTPTVRGAIFMPKYHGRVQVEILGQEIDGMLEPPRFRPLPNSPVFALDQDETQEKLNLGGDVRLGLAVGYEDMTVAVPSTRKDVFPRHVGVLGTTGGGKSTTVSGLVKKLAAAKVAVVLFDTEGEYTHIMQPATDKKMLAALQRRGLKPGGVENVQIMTLVGRNSTNPTYRSLANFSLSFSNLAPLAVAEIINLTDAGQERFLTAYDIARTALRSRGTASAGGDSVLLESDDMEQGYPGLTLAYLADIVRFCSDQLSGKTAGNPYWTPSFSDKAHLDTLTKLVANANLGSKAHITSWYKVTGTLNRLVRLGIFDNAKDGSPDYEVMSRPGQVTIIDLSDTDSPQVNNLVISEILRGLQLQQEENYRAHEKGAELRRVSIVIEEAHEFLSLERIQQMPVLHQQVARIARRGRKRWLGLVFVTQLPQHLPDEVLGLVNNYILHKIADSNVIGRLKRSIGGVDAGLWDRLPNLAPGQAIVSAGSLTRAMLVAIDPTPCELRMVD